MEFIKGTTLEQQMKHVDIILKRFSKRLHKVAVGIIPPIPISGYIQSSIDRVVLRYMFPSSGKITLGALSIEKMPKSGVDIYTVVCLDDVLKSKTFFTKKKHVLTKPDIDVDAGSKLTVSVNAKGEEEAFGIWMSFLWVPEVEDSVIKQFLIDELEKTGEEYALPR